MRGYTLPEILEKIREIFPEFRRDVIHEVTLDRRLRVLDLGGKDYFRRDVGEFLWSAMV